MKLSMLADFRILKDFGDGKYFAMDSSNAKGVSIGGFSFAIDNKIVPFDWEQHCGVEENNLFSYATGAAFGHGDYELDDDCFEEDYANLGIKRENISAEFLASAHHIEEFYINFEDGTKEIGLGHYADNGEDNAKYKLELVEVSFEDIETGKYYDVKKEVLEAFNKGIYREYDKDLSSLDSKIAVAEGAKSGVPVRDDAGKNEMERE